MCIVPVLGTSAQNFIDSLIQVYDHASIEEKRIMDITMTKLENEWKRTQVKEICGIPFGEKKRWLWKFLKESLVNHILLLKMAFGINLLPMAELILNQFFFIFNLTGKEHT